MKFYFAPAAVTGAGKDDPNAVLKITIVLE
jgi:hypothetical protein